ncbi:hypothetical protein ES319_D11G190000v1 [Gossypium barbadense]|uniref:Protein preY, mitochondrial n=2 Tax=Gossypium TaxID=3633 RepID=A0A0D2PBW1_GOSRA|nr:uncharacterized protein LOC105803682 isoform X2 [Gossypium raimondii]KAB2004319.1 hypothetical protein ES319_D11G190000v1 [Gossypium barbadense]KJB43287.1 hypothetical protein B456_007G191900 [Gossypium raimondii]
MVRLSKWLLKEAGTGVNKTLSDILVCPLSKQALRVCEEPPSLISDSIGVSFPLGFGAYGLCVVWLDKGWDPMFGADRWEDT